MDNKSISDNFSVDDIHKLRELQDEKYKELSDDVRIKDYHQVAQKVLEIIHQIKRSKLLEC